MDPRREEGRRALRCQYCGKNLWPLRGLFDEDFCSKDHRQRYHERVRKALEHLPKAQSAPRPGVAGFQFEKPRVQQPEMAPANAISPVVATSAGPASPAIPDFAHAQAPALATSAFRFAAPEAAAAESRTSSAPAVEPNVLSIGKLRERFQKTQSPAAAATMIDLPVEIALHAGNMAMQPSRYEVRPQAFDELNHVFVHEPDPALLASLPVAGSVASRLQPAASAVQPRHTATAGPSGSGRVEFFPMKPLAGGPMSSSPEAEGTLPGAILQAGQNIWLEDPLSWSIPVSMAPTRSSLAMLPEAGRVAALEQFRQTFSSPSAGAGPLAWTFEAKGAESSARTALAPAPATATVIEFPQPLNVAPAPVADESAYIDTEMFALWMPQMAVDLGELEMAATETVEVEPVQAEGSAKPQTATGDSDWLKMDARTVLPASTPALQGALAEPKIGADLAARVPRAHVSGGAESVSPALSVSLPDRMVRLKHGPEFFSAEPAAATSVGRPVSASRSRFSLSLTLPETTIVSETLFQPAAVEMYVPGGFAGEASLNSGAGQMDTASIQMPAIEAAPAAFGHATMEKVEVRFRNAGEHAPHSADWMEPQLELCLPEMHHEDYPLALKVSVPEPRTVTVFETATQQPNGKVLSINEARSKRFAVPSYLKGMAAGLMLASFLWFGNSSIKSGGMTLRPGDLVRLTIQRRAVYSVGDDFHAGLVSWEGPKNFMKSWEYDKEGFVRPGRLALYKPSHDMTDYKLEFLAQIERKSVNWAFRAADEQNYYAMKLAVIEPGPRPLVALVRYQVIDGKKESRGQTPLQVMMHNNRPYRVEVDVKGNQFITSIEGQPVDTWSDDRLKSGGVGFFAEGSEKARLYWMKITKNSDFLGKLCSILVPKES